MQKILYISACRECPYYKAEWCCHPGGDQDVENENVIPKWCPLDAPVERLSDIHDICIGYDGYNTVEGLKSLIDEIREMTKPRTGDRDG